MEAEALAGRRLGGRYELEEPLASGGMATVWRARDLVLGRPVAVKILHDELARDGQLLERFRMEAVAAARLSHPAIVRVFDTGVDDGMAYIVMELFDGVTLGEVLRARGPLRPPEATRIVRVALEGLAHAHRVGVVHRDVKPDNILLGDDGLVKVTDFGIAKAAFVDGNLTTTGNLIGTARYLAPEQVDGTAIDARADLYAAGLVLYELLTGRVPFEADTHLATATLRLTEEPMPPGAFRPGIPRSLDAVVMRALARDPDRRFQSAEEMSAALDGLEVAQAPTGIAPEPGAPPSILRSWLLVPIVLVLLAGLGFGAFAVWERLRTGGAEEPARVELRPVDLDEPAVFDPLGDLQEHDDEVALAVDGEEETAWTTETYTTEDLGGTKPGVGLVFDLGERVDVRQLRLRTLDPGWEFELRVADEADELGDAEAAVDADGQTSFTIDEESLRVDLQPTTGRYVLLWITLLAPSGDGFAASVAEAELFASD